MRILSLVCIPVISVALLFGAGCSSKVGECNKLIGVMNTEGGKLKVSGADPAALKKMADDLQRCQEANRNLVARTGLLSMSVDDVSADKASYSEGD